MVVRGGVGLGLAWFDAVGLGLPLLLLLFSGPLEKKGESFSRHRLPSARLAPHSGPSRKPHFGWRRPEPGPSLHANGAARQSETEKEGFFAYCVEALTEVVMICAELLANSLTFLMVGAYALSHALLSLACGTVAGLAGTRLPGGVFWQILVYAIGNFIILTLEGTIVVVQYLRLLDNEFFPKFFVRSGRPFSPLDFKESAKPVLRT